MRAMTSMMLTADGLLGDLTNPYSAVEAWLYDTLIAPAVEDWHSPPARAAVGDAPGKIFEDVMAALPRGAHVLDVGCGGGHLLRRLAAHPQRLSLAGVDLSEAQIARARRRLTAGGAQVDLRLGDALALPFDDDSFDGVVSVAVIKHWPDQARGLAECARVLRPGGQLLLLEVDRGCRFDDAREFVQRWRYLPRLAQPFGLMLFRTFVAGRSLSCDELSGLLRGEPRLAGDVERVPHTPGLLLRAYKQAP